MRQDRGLNRILGVAIFYCMMRGLAYLVKHDWRAEGGDLACRDDVKKEFFAKCEKNT